MDEHELLDMSSIDNVKNQLTAISADVPKSNSEISSIKESLAKLESRISEIESALNKLLSSFPYKIENNKLKFNKPLTIDNVLPAKSNQEVVNYSQFKALYDLCILTANTVVKEIKKIKERL